MIFNSAINEKKDLLYGAKRFFIIRKSYPIFKDTKYNQKTRSKSEKTQEIQSTDSNNKWVKTIKLEDLPKGERKEIRKENLNVLLFWYKGNVCAIDPRSPAEGAYSEGFLKATFTQDDCIKCPSTGTLFSLKTGDIVDWYPNNPVLRILTPEKYCRPLTVYPVLIDQGEIFVDIASGTANNTTGGAGTSVEDNNIYGIEPKVYLEGTDPVDTSNNFETTKNYGAENAVTSPTSLVGFGIISTAGTALLLYYENFTALILFWIILFSIFAFYAYYSTFKDE